MTNQGWAIRIYDESNYNHTLDFASNYKQFADRQEDDVMIFEGLYGLDSYLIWYMHKNLGNYDISSASLELKLFLDGNTRLPFYINQYKIINIKYDPKQSRYLLYAISIDSAKLQTKLVDYNLKSLTWKENRTPKEVLEEVLVTNKVIDKVVYMEVEYEKSLRNIQYRSLSINEEWKVLDFINYITQENDFEWLLRKGVLYVGKELNALLYLNSTRSFDTLADNISETGFFRKYNGSIIPLQVLSHVNKEWRCVWSKHIVGRSGGLTKGCFTRIGQGTIDKELYFRTLEGTPERILATRLLNNPTVSTFVTIGSIIKDEGDPEFVDRISVQRNIESRKVVNPNDVKIDVGDDSTIPVVNQKEKVCRTTPYLDDGAGLLFPRTYQDYNPPNSLIFNIDGKEQSSVVGPFVMNNGNKGIVIPEKDPDDLRFQLPNGWCLYVDDTGLTIIQTSDTDPEAKPSKSTGKLQLVLNPDGGIDLNCESSHEVRVNGGTISVSLRGHTHNLTTHTHQVAPGPLIPGPPITSAPSNSSVQGESDKHSKHLKCVEE